MDARAAMGLFSRRRCRAIGPDMDPVERVFAGMVVVGLTGFVATLAWIPAG